MRTFVFVATLFAVVSTGWAADGPTVRTLTGTIVGDSTDGVLMFKGIRYAQAPIAAGRWRPPSPPTPWRDVRDATHFGAACPQPARPGRAISPGPTSEDCLFLNVWTKSLDGKRPVMVWIHGGAFRLGSGSMAIYDGARFAQDGVVLVTLNYRLGRFGFLRPSGVGGRKSRRCARQLRIDGSGRGARVGEGKHCIVRRRSRKRDRFWRIRRRIERIASADVPARARTVPEGDHRKRRRTSDRSRGSTQHVASMIRSRIRALRGLSPSV